MKELQPAGKNMLKHSTHRENTSYLGNYMSPKQILLRQTQTPLKKRKNPDNGSDFPLTQKPQLFHSVK